MGVAWNSFHSEPSKVSYRGMAAQTGSLKPYIMLIQETGTFWTGSSLSIIAGYTVERCNMIGFYFFCTEDEEKVPLLPMYLVHMCVYSMFLKWAWVVHLTNLSFSNPHFKFTLRGLHQYTNICYTGEVTDFGILKNLHFGRRADREHWGQRHSSWATWWPTTETFIWRFLQKPGSKGGEGCGLFFHFLPYFPFSKTGYHNIKWQLCSCLSAQPFAYGWSDCSEWFSKCTSATPAFT